MQAYDSNDKPIGLAELFEAKRMAGLLEEEGVDHVRVFHLKEGQVVEVEGKPYKVQTVRANGKCVLKPLKRHTHNEPTKQA